MKHRFLVGAGLAVATALAAPWNAFATTTKPTDPVISGCDFNVSGSTYTLTANCTATATISIPNGVTLNGAGHTITVEGGFTGAVVENGGATMNIQNLTVRGSNLSTGTCNAILGIFFNNASGSLNNVHIQGMTRHNGCQTGFGLRINATSAQTVTITGTTSAGSQKSELAASGRVRSGSVVRYTDVGVLAPVPGHPGQHAAGQFITPISCTPVTLAFTPWRVVVTGTLISSAAR